MAAVTPGKYFKSISWSWPGVSRWLLPGMLAGFVVAHCVLVSRTHLFWADELLTWYPVSARFGAMLSSTSDTINAAPPLYFILTWFWAHVFGNSPLALRLLSALALGAAVLIMFYVLRRVYGVLAAILAVAVALAFCDPALLAQATFARFHTLIVAEVALAILLYQRMMACQGRVPPTLFSANVGIHACIVMTHYFGPLYSGAVLAGVLLTGAIRRFNPFRAVASIVLGWAVFLFWVPSFLRHRDMAKPSFWIAVPDAAALRQYYGHYFTGDFWLMIAAGLGFFALAGIALALGGGCGSRKLFSRIFLIRHRELPLLMLVPGMGAIPLIAYFVSIRPGGASFFLDRYMHSSALGWAILCAHFAHRALATGALNRHFRLRQIFAVAQAATIAAAICWGGCGLLRDGLSSSPKGEYEDPLVGSFYYDKIVVEHIHEYLGLNFYSTWPQRYVFAVDEEVGIREGGGGAANHRIMAGLKRNFPESFAGVVPSDEFLAGAPSFWVKRNLATLWWPLRIEADPLFASEPGAGQLVHVQRRATAR